MLEINSIDIINFRKKFNLTQTEFAVLIGSSLRTVQNYENDTKIPKSKYEIIHNVFAKYEKSAITSADKPQSYEAEIIEDGQEIRKIPFYDVDFYSGFTKIFNDQTVAPSYYFYLPEFHNAQFAIKNSGKSMSKELGNDDILGLREVPEWQTYFPQGEIYAVVTTNDLRTIKKVRRDKDNKNLVLIPKPLDEDKFDYPEYEEVPISMVTALFQVVASTHSKKLAL